MAIRMGRPHVPSGFGKGKWENKAALWKYKLARRKANKRASASRAVNRAR
jgi:hypothetical protein